MTDAQLEVAAREYCKLLGVNPDETVCHGAEPDPNGIVLSVCLYSPRWQTLRNAIQRHEFLNEAIKFAKGG